MNNDVFKGRDLLSLADFTPAEFLHVIEVASAQKRIWATGKRSTPLVGKAVAIVLQKPSMRTRMSFEVACVRLGAHPLIMTGPDGAFSRGESVRDTAKVMERYVDAIVVRTYAQSLIEEFAEACSVPVINALTDEHHPCQGLADFQTIQERMGRLAGVRFAYVGDGNNMAHTYLLAGALSGMDVRIATPSGFEPDASIVAQARAIAEGTGGRISVGIDPVAAVGGADVIATDTWASMGQESEHASRLASFQPFQINEGLLAHASPDVLFMHCLPAHRGEEVTDQVMDHACSIVYDEAENRMHAQKALLSLVLG
ncbi:MAG: ornithine carbamoyltransferase [Actinobacteria bacterium HGW-Actinobacteria-7]|nr:MAG: ornithine carbamoyltransferase [Actinobacteria bacterium HGW-Actinobacteria-7]